MATTLTGSAASSGPYGDLEKQYGAHTYDPIPVTLSKGRGVWVWDTDGHRYLDMMSAYSALSYGHGHPRLLAALRRQSDRLTLCSRAFYNDQMGPFLEKLCRFSGFDCALPMNTGAEAVETAIKAARRYGYDHLGIPADCAHIIVMDGNFHGRTTTLISFSGEPAYRRGFGPLTPGFTLVPFGDVAAIAAAITPHTVAVLMEPIQGEAGIIIPPDGFLWDVQALCHRRGILLFLDEIQSGLGRTGALFAFQHEGIQPDGLILGKALGGGILPISAFLTSRRIMDVFDVGSHGSTFGGNPLACHVAMEALDILIDEQLIDRSRTLGAYLKHALEKAQLPSVRGVRGRGLWIGIDIDPTWGSARSYCLALKEVGILCKETHDVVVRLAPPLVITETEIYWALPRLKNVFSQKMD